MAVSPEKPRKVRDRDLVAAGFALLILLGGMEGWRRHPVSDNVPENVTEIVFNPTNSAIMRFREEWKQENRLWQKPRFQWSSSLSQTPSLR